MQPTSTNAPRIATALLLAAALVALAPAASATPGLHCDVFTPDDVNVGQTLNRHACAVAGPAIELVEDLTG